MGITLEASMNMFKAKRKNEKTESTYMLMLKHYNMLELCGNKNIKKKQKPEKDLSSRRGFCAFLFNDLFKSSIFARLDRKIAYEYGNV